MKKFLSLITVIAIMVSMSVFAAEFKDMPDNWATDALNAAVENGLMNGSDGYIRPDNPMTRAEMAAIIVRATGATEEADISSFSDVKEGDWFYSVMAKAVNMKAFNGSDGKLNPNNNITRQEAFVVLARVFGLDRQADKEYGALSEFKDKDSIAEWAKSGVNMIVKKGYVGGNDGKINPLSNITRAEFAVVMNRLVKYYIDEPGDYTPASDGNIMIRCAGVNINELTTDKMVCVGDLSREDKVTFNKCDLSNYLLIRGGAVDIEGKYNDIKALSKNIVLDITGLSKESVETVSIYREDAEITWDFSKFTSDDSGDGSKEESEETNSAQ